MSSIFSHEKSRPYQSVAWLILSVMLCVSMIPQIGLCFCDGCPCSTTVLQQLFLFSVVSVRQQDQAATNVATKHNCCGSKKAKPSCLPLSQPLSRVATTTPKSGCYTSGTDRCRCVENHISIIVARRPEISKQDDNTKKAFDSWAWMVKNSLSISNTAIIIKLGTQLFPHIRLPRLHLLLSVFLN